MISSGAAEVIFNKFLSDVLSGAVILLATDASVEDWFRRLVLRLLRQTPPILIRTLDGIHLATANLHNAAEFIATDTTLRKAAVAVGFKLYP